MMRLGLRGLKKNVRLVGGPERYGVGGQNFHLVETFSLSIFFFFFPIEIEQKR
jgi:hypothetical protein